MLKNIYETSNVAKHADKSAWLLVKC